MKALRRALGIAVGTWLLAGTFTSVHGQQILRLDEFGNGYITPSLPFAYSMAVEPISGLSTLRYTLPFNGVAGDVRLQSTGGALSDLLRFDGAGHVWFFSDITDGGTISLADVAIFPTPGTPSATLLEQQNGETLYIPNGLDPGYKATGPVAYRFITEVPEPAAIALIGLGAGLLCFRRSRRG